ncbi:MAG: hypothetical protein HY366_02130 [Candidatus Aenigmarchaeota archaeon]|nr:hypothetical protein [Candidatus Aenigmarchaeota archaeon]
MMSKLTALVAILVMMVSPVAVLAQDAQAQTSASASVRTPDSPLWGLGVALDKIRLLLATSDDAKARVGLQIAEKRLIELKAAAEEGKLNAVQKAEREHARTLADVKVRIKSLKDNKGVDELDKTTDIEKRVLEHENNVVTAAAGIEARIKVRGALTEQQSALLQAFLDSLDNSTGALRIEIQNKKEKIRERLEEEGENETEIDHAFNETQKKHRFSEFFKERASERIEAAVKTIVDAKTAAAELSANATTNATARRLNAGLHLVEKAEFHLNVSQNAFADTHYEKSFGQATAALNIARSAERILSGRSDEREAFEKTEREEQRAEEKVEIKIRIDGNRTHVKVEIGRDGTREEAEFTLDATDRETVVTEIDARTSLTREEVERYVGADLTVQTNVRAKFEREFRESRLRMEQELQSKEKRTRLEAELRERADKQAAEERQKLMESIRERTKDGSGSSREG